MTHPMELLGQAKETAFSIVAIELYHIVVSQLVRHEFKVHPKLWDKKKLLRTGSQNLLRVMV